MADFIYDDIPWEYVPKEQGFIDATPPPETYPTVFPPTQVLELPEGIYDIIYPATHIEEKNGAYITVPNDWNREELAPCVTHSGDFHKIRNDSLYRKGKHEGEEYMVADMSLSRIIKQTIFTDRYGNTKSKFVCELKSPKWQTPKEIEVDENELNSVFQKAQNKYHEVVAFPYEGAKAITEHIADVYAKSKPDMIIEHLYEKSGWVEENGIISYKIGTHEHYSRWNIPNINILSNNSRYEIFQKGFAFLEIGNKGKEITTLFLYAHMGYSLYWYRKVDSSIDFLLFIKGWTGSLKTSTILECVNVFEPNVSNRQTQITGSSLAGVTEKILLTQDSVLLLDDYSKTQKTFSNKGDELIEYVVRSIGNGRLPDKKQAGGAKNQPVDVRSLVIITGEDAPELGQSSFLRMLTVTVDTGTFDGNKLRIFQNNRDIMSSYIALYIEFLQSNSHKVMQIINTAMKTHKCDIECITKERRLIENGTKLMAQVDIILAFGYWCGEDESVLKNFEDTAKFHITEIIRDNDCSRQEIRMDALFIIAIMSQIEEGSRYNLAENATEYHNNHTSQTIGFFDETNGRIWLKFEDAMNAVKDYCKSHGKFLTNNQQAIKKALYDHGFLEKPKDGWVWRWTQGNNRGRFVKLFTDKVLNFKKEMDDNV